MTEKNTNNQLKVVFLSEDDALEVIQPIELFPPRMSKLAGMSIHALAKNLAPVRRTGRESVRNRANRNLSDENEAQQQEEEVSNMDVEECEQMPKSSVLAKELANAQLESGAEGSDLAGVKLFSFQRMSRARNKQSRRHQATAKVEQVTRESPPVEVIPSPVSSRCTDRSPQTPKLKSNTLQQSKTVEVDHSNSPQTPRTRKKSTVMTPGRTGKATPQLSKATSGTPGRSRPLRELRMQEQTPQVLRTRVKFRLSKLTQDDLAVSDSDDSDLSEFLPSESDQNDDDIPEEEQEEVESESESPKQSSLAASPPCSMITIGYTAPPAVESSLTASLDHYFQQQSASVHTSDRTLSRLSQPRLSGATVSQLASCDQEVQRHAAARRRLLRQSAALFDRWLLLLCRGFSVLLYGLGSKRSVLEQFRLSRLSDQMHLVVNGFFPNLTARALLRCLASEVLDSHSLDSSQSQLDYICCCFGADSSRRLFLLVPSLDGAALRADKMQQLLCRLASCAHVHLIASVDHVNAPLIWSQNMLASLNPIWFDATTFESYSEETSYENSLLVQSSGALALSSLRHVFQSLTTNARGVFLLLAGEQVAHSLERSYAGMSVGTLYRRCRERFLVSSMVALRAQLTEFRDHKLLTARRAADGDEMLYIQMEAQLLQDFISWCHEL